MSIHYMFLVIGICILVFVSIVLIISTIKMIRSYHKKWLMLSVNVISIIVLAIIVSLSILSTLYNYYYLKGNSQITDGNYEEGINNLNKSLSLMEFTSRVSFIFQKKLFGISLFFSDEHDLRLDIANLLMHQKNYYDAINQYKSALALDDQDFHAIAKLAYCYFLARQFEESRYLYQKLIAINPDEKLFEYDFHMGVAHMVLLNYEKALVYFAKAAELPGRKEVANRYMAICRDQLKGIQEGIGAR